MSFTGSVAAGRAVGVAAAARCVPATLELGGKNALIVCPDWADADDAARVACGANFFNAGQLCVAASRVLVPDALHDAFVAAAVARAGARVLGDQWDVATEVRRRPAAGGGGGGGGCVRGADAAWWHAAVARVVRLASRPCGR